MSSPLSKHLLRLTTPAVCRPGTAALRRYATIAGDKSKETVVVIGGGWAGYNFVRKLDKVGCVARITGGLESNLNSSNFSRNTISSASVVAPTLSLLRCYPVLPLVLLASETSLNHYALPPSFRSTIHGRKTSISTVRRSLASPLQVRLSVQKTRWSRSSKEMQEQRRPKG
jgi:hypothetical protein